MPLNMLASYRARLADRGAWAATPTASAVTPSARIMQHHVGIDVLCSRIQRTARREMMSAGAHRCTDTRHGAAPAVDSPSQYGIPTIAGGA